MEKSEADAATDQIEGGCHCGAVRFRTRLKNGFDSARRRTCSICRMRGAIAISADVADFELLAGADTLNLYRFKTGVAEHYFCSVCGIYTHHRRRSNPGEYGLNAACLQGVSPFDFKEVPVIDGIRHPSDAPGEAPRLAGVLSFREVKT
jgi:hypothetical protein